MSENLHFDNSPPQNTTDSQKENSLENLIKIHNYSSSETKSIESEDKSETESCSTRSGCSRPNELETTFNQAYDPEECNLLEVESSILADTEANAKNKTKPLDVLRKNTVSDFYENKPPQNSDGAQKLDSLSSIERSPKKGSKVEVREEIKRISVPRKRDDSIFQFDEDLNQENEPNHEKNLNLAPNEAAYYAPDNELKRIYENICSRQAELNKLLMAVESLRKFLVYLRGPLDLDRRDKFVPVNGNGNRKRSIDSLLEEQSSVRFRFDDLKAEVKLTWNNTISKCEDFIEKSLKFFKAFRQHSQEFGSDYVSEYLDQMCTLQDQLAYTKFVMLNNRNDLTLKTRILQMFSLITDCDASLLVECSLMRSICF